MPKKKLERPTKSKPKLKALKGELKGEPMHHGEPMKFSHGPQHAPRKLLAHKNRAA